jgi:hypothetical protein
MSAAFEPGLISVIIPTFNRSGLLLEALESVKGQSYRPLEVLIIDDGSSDETPQTAPLWIAEHAGEAFRVIFLRQPNRGAPAARNAGLIRSTGEFIQFLDSDDLLSDDKIALCVAALRADPRAELAYGPTVPFGGETGVDYPGLETSDAQEVLEAACVRSVWTTMGPLYRRELCVEAGPWLENLSCWQDREYALRVLSRLPAIAFVPGAMSYYRLGHGPSIGDNWERSERDLNSIWQGAEAAARAIEEGCGFTPVMRERLARQFVNVGRLLGQLGRADAARAALLRAQEVAEGSPYARTVSRLRLLTSLAGFRLTNRGLALRARLRRRAGAPT